MCDSSLFAMLGLLHRCRIPLDACAHLICGNHLHSSLSFKSWDKRSEARRAGCLVVRHALPFGCPLRRLWLLWLDALLDELLCNRRKINVLTPNATLRCHNMSFIAELKWWPCYFVPPSLCLSGLDAASLPGCVHAKTQNTQRGCACSSRIDPPRS